MTTYYLLNTDSEIIDEVIAETAPEWYVHCSDVNPLEIKRYKFYKNV